MPKKIDLTGQKFGRLTVIEEVGRSNQRTVKWRCKCECGNETIVCSNHLRSGTVKSCGCLYVETRKKAIKNAYEQMKRDDLKEGTRVTALTKRTPKNNTSGTKGVVWDKSNKKWRAQITFKGKKHNLGYFTNKQDAINARKKAEEELYDPILEKYGKKKAD